VYRPSFKNILANILSCHKQDIDRQKALGKTHQTQVLLTPDKLNLEIVCKLSVNLALINSLKASVVLTNSHVFLDLINHIFITNKQSSFLVDKRAKAIRDN
jgi:hypothetical protein